MNEIVVSLKNVPITSFEKGNAGKAGVERPVCALALGENVDGYKIKALFKGQDANDVYAYITSRLDFKDQVVSEFVDITGSVREIRTSTKEIIIDNVTEFQFNITLKIKVK